jgi:hypothetical protein
MHQIVDPETLLEGTAGAFNDFERDEALRLLVRTTPLQSERSLPRCYPAQFAQRRLAYNLLKSLARPARFELTTSAFGGHVGCVRQIRTVMTPIASRPSSGHLLDAISPPGAVRVHSISSCAPRVH